MGKLTLGIFLLFLAGMAFALPDYIVMVAPIFNGTTNVTFQITTMNIGSNATNFSYTNDTLDAPWQVHYVPALNQWETSSYQHTMPCSPGQSVTLFARADIYNSIVESNENNNVGSGTGQCQGQGGQPDLTISALTVPSTMIVGRSYTGTVTTRNIGSGAAGASTTNVQANGQFVANIQVPQLAAGASSTGTFWIQCSSVGRLQVLARADSTGRVSESNENNNLRTATVNCINPPTPINDTNITNISTVNIGGEKTKTSNQYVGILNALGISFSDELLNAICMGR